MSSAAITKPALRIPLRQLASCSRRTSSRAPFSTSSPASSSTSSSPLLKLKVISKATLPEEKMRKLVNLYHQTEEFITEKTLSQEIDKAFVERAFTVRATQAETPYPSLEAELAFQKSLPKFGHVMDVRPRQKTESNGAQTLDWSEHMHPREREVMATLYGVVGKGVPGYDVLKDGYEEVKAELEAEKEQEKR
ncbi:hypothetical protein C8Q80DRAFT_1268641 [Daedaleopsis nitida]|nr:hypothetical protein C8Q80DRAFT_1268641 [Daedaleopsis nitida]